jgi:hypothetical protein
VQPTTGRPKIRGTIHGTGVVSHAGTRLPAGLADATTLTGELSETMVGLRPVVSDAQSSTSTILERPCALPDVRSSSQERAPVGHGMGPDPHPFAGFQTLYETVEPGATRKPACGLCFPTTAGLLQLGSASVPALGTRPRVVTFALAELPVSPIRLGTSTPHAVAVKVADFVSWRGESGALYSGGHWMTADPTLS